MQYKNEKYNAFGGIDCEVLHPVFGWIETTLSLDDLETAELFNEVKNNGSPLAYVAPVLTQQEINAQRIAEIKTRLSQIDSESIRPLRAIAAGTASQFDTDKLTALETERGELVAELVALNG